MIDPQVTQSYRSMIRITCSESQEYAVSRYISVRSKLIDARQ